MEESESECNIANETSSQSDSSNVTTKLNYDDHIKPSDNVKEASYFNMFECGPNILDKLDVTYQSAFTASEKPSSVPPAAAYVSPLRKKYWDVQTNFLTEKMARMDKDETLEAIYKIKHEDEEYHEGMIERLIHEYNDYSASYQGNGTDTTVSEEFNKLLTESDLDICLIDMKTLDKKPAARKDPIKYTPTLKAPATKAYLGKRLCQSESGPTDMRPVITEPLAITENPFNTEP